MYGPVTLEIDGEMKFYLAACSPPLAWPTTRVGGSHDSAKFWVRKNPDQKNPKKSGNLNFLVAISKMRPVFDFDIFCDHGLPAQ